MDAPTASKEFQNRNAAAMEKHTLMMTHWGITIVGLEKKSLSNIMDPAKIPARCTGGCAHVGKSHFVPAMVRLTGIGVSCAKKVPSWRSTTWGLARLMGDKNKIQMDVPTLWQRNTVRAAAAMGKHTLIVDIWGITIAGPEKMSLSNIMDPVGALGNASLGGWDRWWNRIVE